ncbi:MAG TPA: hypothetical protein VFA05_05170 [Gaiellaceae bacterium]|nr:hypothetical protein [Gaiellaceae bacterium]
MRRIRAWTLREWVIAVFAGIGIGLLPWTLWLASSLSPQHVTDSWNLAWSGFDSGLAVLFIATALAAYRRSPWVGALAAATGTLLVTDAWFDIVLESHADERRFSILLALVAELPSAAFCFWIAYRTERFLAEVVDEAFGHGAASHLAAAREGPAEGDLVGVLEVASDREAAGEPSDADTAA